ncbi:P-loop containing nucleoside triphosphate hydrolase protein [Trichoderma barbatum]
MGSDEGDDPAQGHRRQLGVRGPGRSFVTNRKNAWLKPGSGRMMKAVGKMLWERVKGDGGSIQVARFLPEHLPEHLSRVMVAYIAWLLPFEKAVHKLSGIRGLSEKLGLWHWKTAEHRLWNTERLSKHLGLLTGIHLGVELGVLNYRHVAIELGRRIKGLVIRQLELDGIEAAGDSDDDGHFDPLTGESRKQQRTEYIWDLQATHGSLLQPEMVLNFQEISKLWHGFLERIDGDFGAAAAAGQTSPLAAADIEQQRRSARSSASRKVVSEEEIEAGLRRMPGDSAAWKSNEQREGMHQIINLRNNGIRSDMLVLVLLTGGGKSIFFFLPSLLEEKAGPGGRMNIVVVPFVALVDDLVARGRDFGVDCMRWRSDADETRDERQRDASLVVLSADVAGLLGTIFFDECHTIITDAGYRERLGSLVSLHWYGCPMVMLTAMLPVLMEGWFCERMLAQDAAIIRARTTRPNIRYRIRRVKAAGRTAMEARMTGGQKGVVYCRLISECEVLAACFGCVYYYGKMASGVRAEALQAWSDGQDGQRWIVATMGLGTGVDN